MPELTPKQRLFVAEYLKDLNATQACIRAGYSKKNADKIGPELLGHSRVKAAIDERMEEREQTVKIDADYVLKRLHEENEADIADLYDEETGALLPVHQWPLIWRKGLVSGIETVEERDDDGNVIGYARKVKLSERIRRNELIGKHVRVNAFQDIVKHTGLDALAERMERAAKRDG